MLFRPPETLADRRERELGLSAMEERLAGRRPPLPDLPGTGRLDLRRVPGLHDPPQAGVRIVRRAARGDLAGLPVLRDPIPHGLGVADEVLQPLRSTGKAAPEPPSAGVRAWLLPVRSPHPAVCVTRVSRRVAACATTLRRMATETTLVLVKPDGVRRGLCGEVVSRFERRGYELRGARLLKITKAARAAALRRAQGQAVLRRARLVHHLRPRAGARRPRRGRDRRSPHDDGRDPSRERGSGHDPR